GPTKESVPTDVLLLQRARDGLQLREAFAQPGAAIAAFGETEVAGLAVGEGGEADAGAIHGLVDRTVQGREVDFARADGEQFLADLGIVVDIKLAGYAEVLDDDVVHVAAERA